MHTGHVSLVSCDTATKAAESQSANNQQMQAEDRGTFASLDCWTMRFRRAKSGVRASCHLRNFSGAPTQAQSLELHSPLPAQQACRGSAWGYEQTGQHASI